MALTGMALLLVWLTPGTTLAQDGWTSLGLSGDSIAALAIDPSQPATLYAGTNAAGILKSADGGATWTAINFGLPDVAVDVLAVDPTTPSTLYASVLGGGVFKSTDGGASWAAINTGLTYLQIAALAISPATPSTLYAGSYGGGLFESTDGGGHWVPINDGLTDPNIYALAINPTTTATLYAGTLNGAFKSTDGGASWAAIGLAHAGGIDALAIDPYQPNIVYAATKGGVFKSSDDGASWLSTNAGLTGVEISAFAIDPFNTNTIFASAYAGSSRGVFKSTDGGGGWTAINSGLTNLNVMSLAIDPITPFNLYAGTGSGLFVRASALPTPCSTPSDSLLLQGSRFSVAVSWTDFAGNSGCGTPVQLTPDTGYLWFFDSSDVDLIVKVLDGRSVNQMFWLFYGALSSVEYDVSVRDMVSGQLKQYHNPSGQLRSVADTAAFGPFPPSPPAPSAGRYAAPPSSLAATARRAKANAATSTCTPTASSLCVNQARFSVSVVWRDPTGNVGTGTAVPLASDTGYFWFFDPSNVELVVKVLDGRSLNGEFWVFFGALSDVNYIVTVTDTQTGFVKAYVNSAGSLASQADTSAMNGAETPSDGIAQIPGTLTTLRALVAGLGARSDSPTQSLASQVQASVSTLDECLTAALQTGLTQCPAYDLATGAPITVEVDTAAAQLAIGVLASAGVNENAAAAAAAAGPGRSRDAAAAGLPECTVSATIALAQATFCNSLAGTDSIRGINDALDDATLVANLLCLASGGLNVPACAIGPVLATVSLSGTVIQIAACDFASIVPQALSVQPTPIDLGPGESEAFDLQLTMAAKQHFSGPMTAIVAEAIDLLAPVDSIPGAVLAAMAKEVIKPPLENLDLAPEPSCEASAPSSIAGASLLPPTGTGISLAARSVSADSAAKPGAMAHIVPQSALDVAKTPGVVVVTPLAITPQSELFPQTGGTGMVEVTAPVGFPWTATVSPEYSWLTITSGAGGTGAGTVLYSVSANDTTGDRTASMTIAGLSFTVTQASVSVSPPSQAFGSAGGSGSVELNAPDGYAWTAVGSDDWIAITSGGTGSGSGTVDYTVAANTGPAQRTGTITWLETNGPAIATFTVTQVGAASCAYSLAPPAKFFGASGGSGSVTVTAPGGCPWTAVSGYSWITITSGSGGTGSGAVDYSVAANEGIAQLVGTIAVTGQTFTITEAGAAGSGYYYANWNCDGQSQCEIVIGYNVGSAGPFCTYAACTAWESANILGTCDAEPMYPIYYGPPAGTCSN